MRKPKPPSPKVDLVVWDGRHSPIAVLSGIEDLLDSVLERANEPVDYLLFSPDVMTLLAAGLNLPPTAVLTEFFGRPCYPLEGTSGLVVAGTPRLTSWSQRAGH